MALVICPECGSKFLATTRNKGIVKKSQVTCSHNCRAKREMRETAIRHAIYAERKAREQQTSGLQQQPITDTKP